MKGTTHALGGVVFMAGAALATNHIGDVPVWAYGLACASALVPDTDQHQTLLNRAYLLPVKVLTIPLWSAYGGTWPIAHRGRTHSFFGLAFYMCLVAFWFGLLVVAGAGMHRPLLLPWDMVFAAAGIGYLSHMALDLPNTKGVRLLYPLEVPVNFPPWRLLRFKTDSWRAELIVFVPMALWLMWFGVTYASEITKASVADHSFGNLLGFLGGLAGDGLRTLIQMLRDFLTSK